MDGVQVCNTQTVSDNRTRRRAAPRPDRDAAALSKADEIGDNQEIIDKAHFRDHIKLILQALAHLLAAVWIALREALAAALAQVGFGGVAFGHVELGQVVLAELEFDLAARGDLERIGKRLRGVGKQLPHLALALDIKFLGLEFHAGGVVYGLAHLDGHQHILKRGVLPGQVVRVVGRHERDAGFFGHADELAVDLGLFGNAVVLDFQEIIAFTKHIPVPKSGFFGFLVAPVGNQPGQLARKARRQADQPLMVLLEQFMVHARFHIKPLDKPQADHMDEIAVAGHVFAQQNQVAVPFAARIGAVMPGARRDIDLAADDRMDAALFGGAVKVDCTVHHAMVGDGNGGLAELGDAVHQLLNAARPVQQAEFGVHMQVRKLFHQKGTPSCSAILRMRLRRWSRPGLEMGGENLAASSDRLASG